MFVGRQKELKVLNDRYQSEQFEMVVIYGRRRIGKTALINRFIENKKALYFVGVENSAKQNLENLSRVIFDFNDTVRSPDGLSFESFQSAFEYLFKLSLKERIIVVIDEYPYLANSEKSIASILQNCLDRYKDQSHLMLILCGSSMSFMEDEVLSYKAPLHGRRTAQIKLQGFSFQEVCALNHTFSPQDQAMIFGIWGSTPQYLRQINPNLSVLENIAETFLNASSFLYEEPENLLRQECRQAAQYNAVTGAIAAGASRLVDIANKTGLDTALCSHHLKTLQALGLVRRESPYGEEKSKRTLYVFDDHLFRFWYRFIPKNAALIERGAVDLVLKRIQPGLSEIMGPVFEDICSQYLWHLCLTGQCPVEFADIGRWWGSDPKTKLPIEIDLFAQVGSEKSLFAECKWRQELADQSVLKSLICKSRQFRHYQKYYFLFAKNGFTHSCIDFSKSVQTCRLVTYLQMHEEYFGRCVG